MVVTAIIPVRNLTDAKKRLSHHLSNQERRILVLAMLEDVLRATQASNVFKETIVISPDRTVNDTAQRVGARSVLQIGHGLNQALQQANNLAVKEGADATANILADIPLVQPTDFEEILRLGEQGPRVVLSPSLDGGTNIMLRSPWNAIDNAYGRWSFSRHLRAAQKKRVPVYAVSNPRTSFDVDTIDDLRTVSRLDPAGTTRTGLQVRGFGALSALTKNA